MGFCEFKASLVCLKSFRPARLHGETLFKNREQNKQKGDNFPIAFWFRQAVIWTVLSIFFLVSSSDLFRAYIAIENTCFTQWAAVRNGYFGTVFDGVFWTLVFMFDYSSNFSREGYSPVSAW